MTTMEYEVADQLDGDRLIFNDDGVARIVCRGARHGIRWLIDAVAMPPAGGPVDDQQVIGMIRAWGSGLAVDAFATAGLWLRVESERLGLVLGPGNDLTSTYPADERPFRMGAVFAVDRTPVPRSVAGIEARHAAGRWPEQQRRPR